MLLLRSGRAPDEAPAGFTGPPGHPRFPAFDGLRAIAALSVLLVHTAGLSGAMYASGAGGALLAHLDVGVTIFFLISGFLLYRPFAAARLGARPRPDLRRYGMSRVLRIVPAYYLALTVLSVYPGLPRIFGHDWWIYFGFLQTYDADTINTGIGQAWTLGVELSFYAMLPLYALALDAVWRRLDLRRSVTAELGILTVLSAMTLVARHRGFSTDHRIIAYTLIGTMDWFALGMGLAVISAASERSPGLARLGKRVGRASLFAWGLAVAAYVTVSVGFSLPRGFALVVPFTGGRQYLAEHVGYAAVAFLLLLPAVFDARLRSLPVRVLMWRPIAWLGLVSYGIYLWHSAIAAKVSQQAGFSNCPAAAS